MGLILYKCRPNIFVFTPLHVLVDNQSASCYVKIFYNFTVCLMFPELSL